MINVINYITVKVVWVVVSTTVLVQLAKIPLFFNFENTTVCSDVCVTIPKYRNGLKIDKVLLFNNLVLGFYNRRNSDGTIATQEVVILELSESQASMIKQRIDRFGSDDKILYWHGIYWASNDYDSIIPGSEVIRISE